MKAGIRRGIRHWSGRAEFAEFSEVGFFEATVHDASP
jgi:hypothetical protein